MSLSPTDVREWHDVYVNVDGKLRRTIDEAFTEVTVVLKANNFLTTGDDRAEALIAAITRYLVESQEE